MRTQENALVLQRGYDAYASYDIDALNDLISDDVALHVPGRHPLAGDYQGKSAMWEYFGRVAEISGGRGGFAVHSIAADDDHAIGLVVATAYNGEQAFVRQTVHVWHVVDSKLTEFWEASLNQHAEDAFWNAACG
jgi:hypothetical protein